MILRSIRTRIANTFCKSPLLVDLAIASGIAPIFTYIAWLTRSKSSPLYDWQFDRMFKRDTYYRKKEVKLNSTIYIHKAKQAIRIIENSPTDIKELEELFNDLSLIQNCVSDNPLLSAKILDDEFMEVMLKLLNERKRIEAVGSNNLLLAFHNVEEAAACLFLTLSFTTNPSYIKYKEQIESIMLSFNKEKEPYTLRNALSESFFFNMKSDGIVYDGQVVPMNPERMRDYDTDIIFIQGNQSHCFNTWRVIRSGSSGTRTFRLSTIWPPVFLTKKHGSRLLALRYNVRFYVIFRLSKGRLIAMVLIILL